jgi:hypothetical protein
MRRIFPKRTSKEAIVSAVAVLVRDIDTSKAWQVTVEEFKKPRTNQQNAYLWGVVYPAILEAGGEMLRGWLADDLHEYFLGEVYGWETLEGMGRKRLRPLKRTSRMTRSEFMEYLEQVSQRCANLGIVIPEPSYGDDRDQT